MIQNRFRKDRLSEHKYTAARLIPNLFSTGSLKQSYIRALKSSFMANSGAAPQG